MAFQIVLPKLGLTMQEGVIGEWVAQPGQRVALGDTLFRVETDKVDVDVEAEAEGVLATNAQNGAVLPVGSVVGWLLADGESAPDGGSTPTAPDSESTTAPESTPEATPAGTPTEATATDGARLKASPNARRVASEAGVDLRRLTGTGPGGRIVSEDVEDFLARPQAEPSGPEASSSAPSAGAAPGSAATFVGPVVRKLAAELGVDLATVSGSGIGGRVTRADVERAATGRSRSAADTSAAAPDSASVGPQPGDVIPLRGMRGAIARNMMDSLHSMAQLTHGYEVDVTDLVAVRAALKGESAAAGRRAPSLNDFIIRAAALALREHPLLNAGIVDDQIVVAERVDIGVAVAVGGGLVVPVVRDADQLSVGEIAGNTAELAAAARNGKLGLADLEGATFSVSTLGAYGVDFFTPVINPGNVAILGVGRVKDGFRWDGDTPVRTQVLTLSLTFDHRAVDGAPAAEYLRTVGEILGRPLTLLSGA
ncbi:2-oxo acid dehydrogenase subunit E2 [Gordonia terrae]|uniref:Dihydrolipoamide acetyltransferase component of pyruvate dehydrogenase complex n=2 Tax=Gordonia terrae TaxID=2055 RepID=A0AAD0KGE0_9ACTN|nr:2-oxo acid dehydrogenase subunit E2 [Gordonia terrae]VTR08437.1 dihydrolipoyllysine-residue acetyltransferase component of acetoin cleaving system [Clostridioides difficile]ANY25499.1 dihydrolipoamide acetyltransferase [Gordonia terrae]AWO86247.1 dihydrolipoamide acetyltransferase [Gordonia terrae]VTS63598.1 Dihydrolipoyllysine-residue acetyltransferase component of pyruvate dehydrogenase complex [Gordonia terrae]GAB45911.1 dihydrolipoamide acetyltransferase [Gordonia terrae NBRC 100016]